MTMKSKQWTSVALTLALLVLVWSPNADAQNPPNPTPNDTLVSPRVADNGQVTFQLYAPEADEVTVRGDWNWGGEALEKDEQGVWSVTLGPLAPDVYTYTFSVDGVRLTDPRNPAFKEGLRSLESLFEVSGEETEFMAVRDVPHGVVHQVWYTSESLGVERRMHVYTPPGYRESEDTYPVLYLLHGGGDNDAGWTGVGRANFILDNLIAEDRIEPMVVVMPAGHTPVPGFFMGAGPDQDPFSKDLLQDIIPYVEDHYHVSAQPEDRAIAGLSMGGVQTLNLGLFNPDTFSHVVAMSTGYFPDALKDLEENYADVLQNPDLNDQLELFWIGIGTEDFANENNQNTMALLDKYDIAYTYHETGGGHTWSNWRRYLRDVTPLLFR